jgi:ribonuclease III
VRRLFRPQAAVAAGRTPPADHKTALQERLQGQGLPTPFYQTIDEAGPDHRKQFRVRAVVEGRVLGEGEGGTKKAAEQAAAAVALRRLLKEGAGEPPPGGGCPPDCT